MEVTLYWVCFQFTASGTIPTKSSSSSSCRRSGADHFLLNLNHRSLVRLHRCHHLRWAAKTWPWPTAPNGIQMDGIIPCWLPLHWRNGWSNTPTHKCSEVVQFVIIIRDKESARKPWHQGSRRTRPKGRSSSGFIRSGPISDLSRLRGWLMCPEGFFR